MLHTEVSFVCCFLRRTEDFFEDWVVITGTKVFQRKSGSEPPNSSLRWFRLSLLFVCFDLLLYKRSCKTRDDCQCFQLASCCVLSYLPKKAKRIVFGKNSAKEFLFYCHYYDLMCYKNHLDDSDKVRKAENEETAKKVSSKLEDYFSAEKRKLYGFIILCWCNNGKWDGIEKCK